MGAKVGEIWILDSIRGKQMFFIHSIIDSELGFMITSGLNDYDEIIYTKGEWNIRRKASEEEERRFYQLIEERGLKFNRNTGVSHTLNV